MEDLPDEVAGVGTPPVRYRSNNAKIVDVFSVIDAYRLTYYEGHALKYLVRLGKKGSTEGNLGKCRHFLKEAEIRAPVEVPWWTAGVRSAMPVSDILDAFGLREIKAIADVAHRLLMSKVDNEPRYWLRSAGEQLDKYLDGTYEE